MFAQHAQGVARAAHVRAEVQIGEDQRVKESSMVAALRRHSLIVANECYEVMNWVLILRLEVTHR